MGEPDNTQVLCKENLPVGTMVFMAPETFTNPSPQLTGQTDVWALGVILTWIMTAIETLGLVICVLPLQRCVLTPELCLAMLKPHHPCSACVHVSCPSRARGEVCLSFLWGVLVPSFLDIFNTKQQCAACSCWPGHSRWDCHRLGSLQHPNLDREDGQDFCVKWIDMLPVSTSRAVKILSFLERLRPSESFFSSCQSELLCTCQYACCTR